MSVLISSSLTASSPTALDIVTLVIAVLGALTGIASLVWSIVAHVSAGVRGKVAMRCGVVSNAGWVSFDPGDPDGTALSASSHLRTGLPAFGVQVRNVGRLPLVVERISIHTQHLSFAVMVPPFSHPLPHTLGISESSTWFIPAEEIGAMVTAARATGRKDVTELWPVVDLGNGTTITEQHGKAPFRAPRRVNADQAISRLAAFLAQ